MKLSGLTLETAHFEDYLSFLTEVVELELNELTSQVMRLDLYGTWFEILKVEDASTFRGSRVEFSLGRDEYVALKQRVSFFYYRKGPTRFQLVDALENYLDLVDPDGRLWRFVPAS